jgi:hypothetical protein
MEIHERYFTRSGRRDFTKSPMNTPRIAAGSYTNATKADQMKYREANREALRERKRLWRKERKLLCAAAIPTDLKREGDR